VLQVPITDGDLFAPKDKIVLGWLLIFLSILLA
jgi:hypothetical protein